MGWKVVFASGLVSLVFIEVVFGTLPGLLKDGEVEGRLMNLEECDKELNAPLQYKDVIIQKVGKDKYTFEGKIIVKEVIEGPLKVITKVTKCKDVDKPDTCEHFTEIKTEDACGDLEKGRGEMKEMFEKAQINIKKCPVPPKNYTIKKFEVEFPQESKTFVALSNYWKAEVRAISLKKGKDYKKLIFCYEAEVELKMKEKKERTRKFG